MIDYTVYDKQRRYEIKWIKWSNFMSYGPDNEFDFTKLKGLVLLNGIPQNQTGKSTFCNDLIKFLLFGKVTSRNVNWTLSEVFNYYLPEATEVYVEGCLTIDGCDYIIKRTVNRPELKKRSERSKVVQKVSYYKLINNEKIELLDGDSLEGENSQKTNQIIKEAIGNDKDFDLVICANADNLKSLISLKDTERGRLLSRWIGLLPLEEKDKLAREKYNKEIVPKLLLNIYNKEQLIIDNETLTEKNKEFEEEVRKLTLNKEKSIKNINEFEEKREKLLLSKKNIDSSLLNIDVNTVENELANIESEGKKKKSELLNNKARLNQIKDVSFSENEYKDLISKDKSISIELNSKRETCQRLKDEIKTLKKNEYCPTCGAKLKGIDNTDIIKEKKILLDNFIKSGVQLNTELKEIKNNLNILDEKRLIYNEKVKLELIIDTNNADIENLKGKYREKKMQLNALNENKEIIKTNNKIDADLNIIKTNKRTIPNKNNLFTYNPILIFCLNFDL